MTSTTTASRPAPPDEDRGTRLGAGLWSSPWVVPVAALLGWFVGLLPWLVTRSRQGTFGTPWNPRNDLRDALLPYHHQLLPLLVVVAVVAGILAGSAPWCATARRSRRLVLAALTTLGALLGAGWSVVQTLAPDPDLGGSGATADRVRLAFVAVTVAGALLGLALGLTVSLAGAAVRAVAAAPAAVFVADWLGRVVLAGVGSPGPTWLSTLIAALSGAAVGLALTRTARSHPVARVAAWACSLGLLVVTASALTAMRYVLEALRGTPIRGDALSELLADGVRVLGGSLEANLTAGGPPPAAPLVAVVVAAAVGAVGTLLVARASRSRDGAGRSLPHPRS
ncbi:hypothetical protein [Terrabacter carboxydivorans]|uniref:Integral membrane protein n=1 Tax=Terrabacter carboxydivorans TaxID=619730 RepID=A0ABN3LM24_9MICO